MPNITLTNNTTFSLTGSSNDDNATLNRYLEKPLVFLAPAGFEAIADKTIGSLNREAFPLTAAVSGGGTFAVKGNSLGVALGASASIGFTNDDGTAVVSFGVQGTLSAGPTFATGDFSFGVNKGATVGLTSSCDAVGTETFGTALKRALSGLTIPEDIEDLKSLPVNTQCKIDASSSLQFTASITYSFVNNPLATTYISNLPSLSINANAQATHEATATHTADHTINIAKLPDGLLHLAVNLAKIDDFETSLTVSAGVTAGVGNADALPFLIKVISPNATAEMAKLSADMPTDQAERLSDDIKDAMSSAMSRSLRASLKAALDIRRSENRLFLYEIDLGALDKESTTAVQSALRGDFTKITGLQSVLAGIRELDSALTTTSRITHGMTLHLLGIFNWQSTNAFLEKSKIDYTKDTHEIVLSDEAIKIVTNNLDSEKLREVLVKGLTLTLPASANTPAAKTPINVVFFERKAATDPLTMRQFANVLQIVGNPDAGRAMSLLNQELKNYGTSSLSLGLNLTPAQCRQLFIGGQERSYDWTHYVNQACAALASILAGCADATSLGRLKLSEAGQAFWILLKDAGATALQIQLLASRGIGESATVDVATFIWWSAAMERYSKALAAEQSLVNIGKDLVKDSTRGFDEPWLVLAIWNMLQKPTANCVFTSSLLK